MVPDTLWDAQLKTEVLSIYIREFPKKKSEIFIQLLAHYVKVKHCYDGNAERILVGFSWNFTA